MPEDNKPKIAVVGAGAVGSTVGALMARAGEDVTLIARQPHAEAINTGGLRVAGALGQFTVHPHATHQLAFRPDLVLLTVKTQDVAGACEAIAAHVAGVPLVTLQNGVRADAVAASVLRPEDIVSGIAFFNSQFLEPGKVRYNLKGSLLIGESFTSNGQRVEWIRELLSKGIKTDISADIVAARWTKLLVNCLGNSLEAMTGTSLAQCMQHPSLRRIGAAVLKESLSVTDTARIRLAGLPGLPPFALRLILRSPLPIASSILKLFTGSTNTMTSTLQRLTRNRPTEIEYLNGEIVHLGQQSGVPTPFNDTVVELVHQIERTRRFLSAAELGRQFSSLQGDSL